MPRNGKCEMGRGMQQQVAGTKRVCISRVSKADAEGASRVSKADAEGKASFDLCRALQQLEDVREDADG